jgi:hypothetical protein
VKAESRGATFGKRSLDALNAAGEIDWEHYPFERLEIPNSIKHDGYDPKIHDPDDFLVYDPGAAYVLEAGVYQVGGGGDGTFFIVVGASAPSTPADPAPPLANDATLSKADLTYISGQNRVLTSIAISQQGWSSADTVILAPGADANLTDALTVAPLAYQKNAPILLSVDTTIDPAILAEIQRLGATKIIAGGALSDTLIEQLRTILPNVAIETLRGADRFATASLINAKITNIQGTIVVGYNAIADAVSIASWAAANAYAIQIANPDGSANPPSYGSGNASGTNYILGGPTLVRDIPGYTRIYGADRYATNLALRQALDFNNETIYTADGNTLVDALTGSVLAAKTRSAIVLTPNNDPTGTDFGDITPDTKAYALGGAK